MVRWPDLNVSRKGPDPKPQIKFLEISALRLTDFMGNRSAMPVRTAVFPGKTAFRIVGNQK
jgi:hypothetical protein